MLLALVVTALMFALAVWTIGRTAVAAMERLGLEPMTVLLWLGLAEWPPEPRPRRRPARVTTS